jgi:hypothetical protein
VRTGLRFRCDWLLTLLLLGLVGCGPGVGGTGTGEQSGALVFFGAKPASVCTASFAGQLKCPSRIVIGPTRVEPAEGSEVVIWVDDPANARVTVRINVSDMELQAFCEGVRFTGTWGAREDEGGGRFYGYYATDDLSLSLPGTVSVQAVNGAGLAYVLQDATGRVLSGPLRLQNVTGEPRPPQCP